MLNSKIIEHLAGKAGKKSNKNDEKILAWLGMEDHKTILWEPTYISQDLNIKGGSLYSSIYRLASQEKIGFASRDYHTFRDSSLARIAPRVKIVVWHKDYSIEEPAIRDNWTVPISSDQMRGSLFPVAKTPEQIIESADVDDLQKLIELAKKRQVQIGIDRRYACLSKAHRDILTGVFSAIGITDPVYFAHDDDDISLLTYTAVPDMPIDVVIDEGDGPRHISAKHLTLFGKRLIAYTDSMFSSGAE